jgi:hypothetical protein
MRLLLDHDSEWMNLHRQILTFPRIAQFALGRRNNHPVPVIVCCRALFASWKKWPQTDAFLKQECENHDYASENKLSLSLHLQVQDHRVHTRVQVVRKKTERRNESTLGARTFLMRVMQQARSRRVTTRSWEWVSVDLVPFWLAVAHTALDQISTSQ